LDVEGEGQVCAGDIKPSADFEIVNPELYLASLDSSEAKLCVEFNVEVDKGYRPAKHHDGLPIGVIPVDAIFTPVRKVNFRVEPSHIVQETSCERLTLEVWTDGSISAVEAVSRSADILVEHFSLLTDLVKVSERTAEKEALRLAIPAEQYDMPVEQMGLSVRTLNCLRRGEITTVGQLLEKSPQELMALRSFGQKSLDEINERLRAMGLAIPGEVGVAGEEAGEEDNVDEGD
jgi:DNA-directed RNA polymerase subunit alpha